MDERGKGLEAFGNQINNNNNYADFSYSSAPCKQHPYSSAIGICAHCLKDRLVKLVCSECGEQRMSSCSCSDVSSSYRNSCSTSMEVGSVGRVSFLIENDQKIENNINSSNVPTKEAKPEQVIFLRRSSSSCVEVKKTNGFWKIKRLFRKRKDKQGRCVKNDDEDGEVWVSDVMGVTRSRSVCSFRGVGNGSNFNDVYEDYRFSSAKISDVTGGIFLDCDKQCGSRFESESRRSGSRDVFDADHDGIDLKRVKSHNKIDFTTAMDESSYIDLKLDSPDVMKQAAEFSSSGARISTCSDIDDHGLGFFKSDATGKISVNENGLLKKSSSRRHHNHSVWKWILKYHPSHNKKAG